MVDRPRSDRRTRRATAAVAFGLIGAVLAGCGSQIPFGTPRTSDGPAPTTAPSREESPRPSASAPTGTDAPASDAPFPTPGTADVIYNVAGAGATITLPAGWVGYDARTPEAAILAATREHPELTASFEALRTEQLLFVAVDVSATGEGPPPSMTIAGMGSAITSPQLLESFATTYAGQIRSNPDVAGEVELQPTELPAGPAVNLRWQLEAEGDAEPLGIDAYVLSAGDRSFLVTFAAAASEIEDSRPAFQAIAASVAPG